LNYRTSVQGAKIYLFSGIANQKWDLKLYEKEGVKGGKGEGVKGGRGERERTKPKKKNNINDYMTTERLTARLRISPAG
jgi:hypothetical protein